MRKSALVLLSLIGILTIAGCSATPAARTNAASSPEPTTALIPTPTRVAASHCPQLPAAQSGQAPAAPPSLYISRSGTALAALNPSDGSVRWQDTIEPDGLMGDVQVANNVVYVSASYGNADGILAALNASDGRLRWCISLEPLISNPYGAGWAQVAVDQQTVYTAGGEAGSLRAVNTGDGTERWHAFAAGTIETLAAANGRVYVSATMAPSTPTNVMALNASDGQTAWSVQPKYTPVGQLAVVDGTLYTSEREPQSSAGFLDALNASNGALRWRVPESLGDDFSQLVVADGIVYVADISGVVAFAASSGARRWQVQSLGVGMVGPAAANGAVYVAWVDGTPTALQIRVTALNGSTGQQQWQMSLPQMLSDAQTSPQVGPASSKTFASPLESIDVINGVVLVSYVALTPSGDHTVIATLNAQTGQRGWSVEGGLLAAG